MDDYRSSEDIRRQNSLDVFAIAEKKKKMVSNKDQCIIMLDKYIARHNSTKWVKEEAENKKRDNGYQLDISADIVDILTKIKSELR